MRGRKMLAEIIVPASAGVLCFIALSLVKALPAISAASGAADALNMAIFRLGFRDRTTPALMGALLTGNKSHLDYDTIEIFRKSGASHLLALSGLHLGFIYSLIRKILQPLGNSPVIKAVRVGTVIGFCSFYTIMTGAGPSITRALLFIVINEACSLNPERKKSGTGVLSMAFVIQVTAMPGVVRSVGFQLSYLAMAGIFLLGIPMQKWFPQGRRTGILKKIWDASAISISCQAFTAPLSWYYFHSFPRHFLLANILALPVTEVAILLSIITITAEGCNISCNPLVKACDYIFKLLVRILETISEM
ncbi:MAG: ComEC/Rec2 family competence protein [Bacteroidales bacterium]|nr:ComEC/Rec2 family competence protein [Bacteroidales bacterium]